jgi:hypothetical protein
MTNSHSKHINLYVFQRSGSQHNSGAGYDFVDTILNLTGGSDGSNDSGNDVVT